MNGILGLSKRESEVYSFMIMLDSKWVPQSDKDYKDITSTTNRKLMIKECNINKTNLSRLIIQLKGMDLLVPNINGGYEIPSALSIDLNNKIIEIVFTLEILDNEGTRQNN